MNPEEIIVIDPPPPPPKQRKPRKKKQTVEEVPPEPQPQPEPRALFPHQLESVELMEAAERGSPLVHPDTGFTFHRSYGELSNPVGSGKTTVALQLIKNDRLKFETLDSITLFIDGNILTGSPQPMFVNPETRRARDPQIPYILYPLHINIVVCSKALTLIWKKEAQAMDTTNVVIDVPKQVSCKDRFLETIQPLLGVTNGVLILSSHIYGEAMHLLVDLLNLPNPYGIRGSYLCPKRLILDDIHAVSKWSSANIKVCPLFTWSINSTPICMTWGRVLWNLSSHFLTAIRDRYAITQGHVVHVEVPENFYQEPPMIIQKHYYKSNDATRLLTNYLPPHVKDMLETGDFDGAYQAMVGAARGEEDTAGSSSQEPSLDVSGRKPLHELILYRFDRELKGLEDRRERIVQNGYETANVDQAIAEQKRKIDNLKDRLRVAETETTECPICLDETERGNLVTTKCCFNSFCRDCILNGCLRTTKRCPLCRSNLSHMDLYSLRGDGTAVDLDLSKIKRKPQADNLPSTPMAALQQLVNRNPQGKFVVFASNQGTSKTFCRFFKEQGIVVEDMTGMATTIQKRLERFQNGQTNILFLGTRTSNAGLNLQFATDVVILDSRTVFDPKSPEYIQSVGRVRRFPRRDPVPVHYICPDL